MKKIGALIIISTFLVGCQVKQNQAAIAVLNKHVFELELARTPVQQQRGLSGHAQLNDHQGMLFIFNSRQVEKFWMKDMTFPLDIIWLDNDKIVKISSDLIPEGERPLNIYSSDVPVDHVLEVLAGTASRLKLQVGDKIQYEY